jgi:hypothetical protein
MQHEQHEEREEEACAPAGSSPYREPDANRIDGRRQKIEERECNRAAEGEAQERAQHYSEPPCEGAQ